MKRSRLKDLELKEFSLVRKPAHEGATTAIIKGAAGSKLLIAKTYGGPSMEIDDIGPGDPNDPKTDICPTCKKPLNKSHEPHITENATMTDQEKAEKAAIEKKLADAEKDLSEAKAKVAKAEKIAELTEGEKQFYRQLNSDEQVAFLAKSATVRAEDMKPVYEAENGAKFTRIDDPRLVEMAKAADASTKEMRAKLEKAENDAIFVRVEKELTFLPGSVDDRAELLKAALSIKDEKKREGAVAALKAHNEKLGRSFGRQGTGSTQAPTNPTTPAEKLRKMVEDYAKEHKVSIAKAELEVSGTDAGAELYGQIATPVAPATA